MLIYERRVLNKLSKLCVGFATIMLVGACLSAAPEVDQREPFVPANRVPEMDQRERFGPAGPSDFQSEILVDGEVSRTEYERAVFATVNCLTDAGVATAGPMWTQDGRYLLYTFTSGENGAAVVANDRCSNEYLSEVQPAYAQQVEPSEEAVSMYATCLRSQGVVEATEGLSAGELEVLAIQASVNSKCLSPLAVVIPSQLVRGPNVSLPNDRP